MNRFNQKFDDRGLGSPGMHQSIIYPGPTMRERLPVIDDIIDLVAPLRNRKGLVAAVAGLALIGGMSIDRAQATDRDICIATDAVDGATLNYDRLYLESRGAIIPSADQLRDTLQPAVDKRIQMGFRADSFQIDRTLLCAQDRGGFTGDLMDHLVGSSLSIGPLNDK